MTFAIFACCGSGRSRAFQQVVINIISSNTICRNLSAKLRNKAEWKLPLEPIGSQNPPSLSIHKHARMTQRSSRLHHKPVSVPTLNRKTTHVSWSKQRRPYKRSTLPVSPQKESKWKPQGGSCDPRGPIDEGGRG